MLTKISFKKAIVYALILYFFVTSLGWGKQQQGVSAKKLPEMNTAGFEKVKIKDTGSYKYIEELSSDKVNVYTDADGNFKKYNKRGKLIEQLDNEKGIHQIIYENGTKKVTYLDKNITYFFGFNNVITSVTYNDTGRSLLYGKQFELDDYGIIANTPNDDIHSYDWITRGDRIAGPDSVSQKKSDPGTNMISMNNGSIYRTNSWFWKIKNLIYNFERRAQWKYIDTLKEKHLQ